MLSLQVFKKLLIIFGLIAVPSSLLALWFGADATFKEKMILSLIFGIVMPLAFFIFYKITSLFLK
ncbi:MULTISPECIES: hypothetical protein [Bacillus]|uniref:hypothetical protein n=1 Tax=Bacillus TaxID=1386 RepID=UPI00032D8DED|nr:MULTISPECIES: hypothetical protein [Bacillus cereus group]EOQ34319.1 hypothetical protein KQ1_00827 [Bacillus cereus BAG3O-1]MBJ8119380.1 hypothetical protein [Bacillus cereus]RFB11778.1 hypothetical protein DZB88_18445 [Bacillus sp. OE]RFB27956.1 hypothetical protein DZB85_07085 [Bacillus sp. LB(2018)]RFB76227.1 hypothetical protein DZB94_09050 [Bacillus sp. AW]HDR8169725.1 hypothetical protein [Bacillus thuringiensis]